MRFLGLDIDGKVAHLALINSHQKVVKLQTQSASDVKQLYKAKNSPLKNTLCVSALDGKQVIIRQKKIKATSRKTVKKALPFQLKSCTSLAPEQTIFFPIFKFPEKKTTEIHFYITTKKILKNYLTNLQEIDLDPDYISCQSQALNRFVAYHLPENTELYALHINKSYFILVHIKNKVVMAHHSSDVGIDALFEAYLKDHLEKKADHRHKIDLVKPCKNNTHLIETITGLEKEIKRGFTSFMAEALPQRLPILITGQISSLKNLDQYLLSCFPEMISEILPIQQTDQLPYAISIGLGLDCLLKDSMSMQFRQQEFIAKKTLKKEGSTLLAFLMFSLILSLLCFFTSERILTNKKSFLLDRLSVLEKKENLVDPQKEAPISIDARLNLLNEKIKKDSKKHPYLTTAPKLCHFFNWLNSLPLVQENFNNIEILAIDYELEDSQKNNEERGGQPLAKIILTVKIKDLDLAQKFHKSLTKKNALIDSSKEILWDEIAPANYCGSFYLKKPLEEIYD